MSHGPWFDVSSGGRTNSCSSTQEPVEKGEKGKRGEKKEGRPSVSLGGYRPFFRELDMEVLSVLQCGLLSRSPLDTELHTKVPQLTPTFT